MGFPKEIQCDQGSYFTSQLTNAFLRKFNIKLTHSSVYHPQSNMVERLHRTLKRILTTSAEEGEEWEKLLPMALFTVRNVINETTGFSPAELVFGKTLRSPETLIYERWLGETDEYDTSVIEYVFTLSNRLAKCQELAATNAEIARDRRKAWYDKHTVERTLEEGELVLVLKCSKRDKFSAKWQGPGKVLKKIRI